MIFVLNNNKANKMMTIILPAPDGYNN